MTEGQWLASEDWHPMLRFLHMRAPARKEDLPETYWDYLYRKEYLFFAACCRLLWDRLTDGFRSAVVDLERRADDTGRAGANWDEIDDNWDELDDGFESSRRAAPEHMQATFDALEDALWATYREGWAYATAASRKKQSPLARDIFGSPFRPVVVDPAWLLWNGGLVRRLAQSVYADRAFDRRPVLGDALEEAGCTDADILSHCRSGGPHVRGCWVVDALLGKASATCSPPNVRDASWDDSPDSPTPADGTPRLRLYRPE
jgi:hypothetical protein